MPPKSLILSAAVVAAAMSIGAAQATTITADIVISYSEPTVANPTGPFNGVRDGLPNGLNLGGSEYERVDLNVGKVDTTTVTGDGSANTYVSLVKDSEIVLGFSTGFIFDGTGDDLFVAEVGAAAERAEVFISEDFGQTFTFLATAFGNQVTAFDFADYTATIGTDVKVNAVKLVGLDDGGSSPGFDLLYVEGLEGSVIEEPQGPTPVPLPAAGWLMLSALGGVAALRRKKRS